MENNLPPEPELPDSPGDHPPPPQDFDGREIPIIELADPFYRIHLNEYDAIYFGRSGRGRFDGPQQVEAICYIAMDEYGAFIESFGRTLGNRYLDFSFVSARRVSQIFTNRALRICPLMGAALAKVGADGRLATGSYAVSRQWANAIAQHPRNLDGIAYLSRHDTDRVCIALFERCRAHLTENVLRAYGDPAEASALAQLLDHYGFGLQ